MDRSKRPSNDPAVFYGPIASGNSVIKNSRIRDGIARPLGILCFEMEAAGLMDILPCLIVRGISDYCDARKSKQFQPYSALSAAAYAKELLSVIPEAMPVHDQARQIVLESLQFEEEGNRLMAIKPAHPETCIWLHSHPTYQSWLNDDKLCEHHGLLWIKGKPGAGKSTLMKYILEQSRPGSTVLSFFFNARGKTELEKSTSGLYRSLLRQLLTSHPHLTDSLDWFVQPNTIQRWNLDILQNVFVSAIKATDKTSLFCFVDALDESTEDEIRDMVEVFEELGKLTAAGEIMLRVCYASRYYPHISVKAGLELRMDESQGHWLDMKCYIDAELQIGIGPQTEEIKSKVLSKSKGIFLWVVLVVRILKKEYDSGRVVELANSLKRLPSGLNDLFRDIILGDEQNLDDFLLCIQLVLYASSPLTTPEFYFAMQSRVGANTVILWDRAAITMEDITHYITSTFKGLVELFLFPFTLEPHVQFIHDSLRGFLLDQENMVRIWPGFKALTEGVSHETLKTVCSQYLERVKIPDVVAQEMVHRDLVCELLNKLAEKYPFANYATRCFQWHDDGTSQHEHTQAFPLNNKPVQIWTRLDRIYREGFIQSAIRNFHNSLLIALASQRTEEIQALEEDFGTVDATLNTTIQ